MVKINLAGKEDKLDENDKPGNQEFTLFKMLTAKEMKIIDSWFYLNRLRDPV